MILQPRKNHFYLFGVLFFQALLSPSLTPTPPSLYHTVVEWFMYVVFLNLLLSATKTKLTSTHWTSFHDIQQAYETSSSVPAECSCVSMDLNVSVIIPALLDIQVVPSSSPVFKANTVCSDEWILPCQAKSLLASWMVSLTVDFQNPRRDISKTFPVCCQKASFISIVPMCTHASQHS